MRLTWSAVSVACLLINAVMFAPAHGAVVLSFDFEEGSDGATATGANSVLDSSGNGLNGTPIGGPVYRLRNGSLGLSFDGSNDRIAVADDPALALTQSLSIEAHIEVASLSSTQQHIVFRGDGRGGLDPYTLNLRSDGVLRFQIQNELNQGATVRSTDPVALNERLHVIGTLNDATDEMQLFVNGQLVGTNTTSIRPFGQLDASANPGLGIGSRQDGSDDFFIGFIDNVRIHNDVVGVPEPSMSGLLAVTTMGTIAVGRIRRRRSGTQSQLQDRS